MFKFCPYCGNKVSRKYENGFKCPKCDKWTHYISSPTTSVVVKVGKEVLLSIRAIEPEKGELDIVGGFLKYGEDPIKGAVREFKEEVGVDLDPSQLKFLGIWIGTYHYQGLDDFAFNVVYLLELKRKFQGKPADDVEDLVWVPLSSNPKFAFSYLDKVWQKIRETT